MADRHADYGAFIYAEPDRKAYAWHGLRISHYRCLCSLILSE